MWHFANNDREYTRPAMPAGSAVLHAAWRVALAVTLAMPLALLGPGGFSGPPAAYAQQSDGVLAVVNVADAPLLAAPGGATVDTLALGSVVTAVQRTADGQMVEVVTETGVSGWVDSTALVAFGLDKLPVAGDASPPAPADTGAPAAATAAATAASTVAATATARPSPTPAPTATPKPTATPTLQPTPLPTPTARPAVAALAPNVETATGGQLAVVGMEGAALYDAPDGAEVAQLGPADTLTVIARDAAGGWLYATSSTGDKGWTEAENLVVFGIDALPVLAGGEAGAPAPESAAAPAEPIAAESPAAEAVAPETDAAATTVADTAATNSGDAATNSGDAATNSGDAATTAMAGAGQVSAQVNADGSRLNVRAGPGASFRVVGKAADGEVLTASGRNAAGDWVRVERTDLPGGAGWVATSFMVLDQPVDGLPVIEVAAPGAAATVAAPVVVATVAAPVVVATVAAPVVVASAGATAGATASATASAPAIATAAATRVAQPVARTSPTGLSGKLAFMDGLGGIYLYELVSGAVRRLTSGYDPELSPDGSQVAFTRGGNDNNIYVINVDGSGEREVFGDGELLRAPKWSPDGQRIAFSRYAGDYRCYDTEFFGCITKKQLTLQFPEIPPMFIYKLLNGADRIALPNFNISRVNLDGSDFRDLNALDSGVAPDWNEAGIVYQSNAGLEVTEDKPEGQTKAIFQEDWDWDPDWQPNGGRIVFQSKEGPHWEIWSIAPDGGGIVALTRPVTTLVDQLPSNVAPAWSPDGQQIAYVSNRNAENDAGPWRIWVMNADGSNQRPLPLDIPIEYTFAVEQMVSWGR